MNPLRGLDRHKCLFVASYGQPTNVEDAFLEADGCPEKAGLFIAHIYCCVRSAFGHALRNSPGQAEAARRAAGYGTPPGSTVMPVRVERRPQSEQVGFVACVPAVPVETTHRRTPWRGESEGILSLVTLSSRNS